MKKILIASNLLLLGIVVFMACNPSGSNSGSQNPSATSVSHCSGRVCIDSTSDLTSRIEGYMLDSMSRMYARDVGKGYITGSLTVSPDNNTNTARMSGGSRDALSVVFDLEKIKTLIWMMQKNVCRNNCNDTTPLGIRYYFIKYPGDLGGYDRNDGLQGLPASNSNKHSLVMVPVYKFNNEWYDYDLFNKRDSCFRKIRTLGDDREFPLFFGFGTDNGDNHGGIGPPPDPGTFPTSAPGQ